MVEAGLFEPKFQRNELIHMKLLPRSQIDEFLGRLSSQVSNSEDTGSTITMKRFTKNACLAGHTLKQVFQGIFDGKIVPCTEDDTKPLFDRFMFREADVKSFLHHLSNDLPSHLISRDAVMKRLSISRPFMDAIAASGFITTVVINRDTHVFLRAEIEDMDAKWTHLGRLAQDLGTRPF
jgi:hypothetical protein